MKKLTNKGRIEVPTNVKDLTWEEITFLLSYVDKINSYIKKEFKKLTK